VIVREPSRWLLVPLVTAGVVGAFLLALMQFHPAAPARHAAFGRWSVVAGVALFLAALAKGLWLRRRLLAREREREACNAGIRNAVAAADMASQEKISFLAHMSHELRTPLHGVFGMVELALQGDLLPEQREYLQVARRSCQTLLGVVDDILDFSRMAAGRLELDHVAFELAETVEDAVRTVAAGVHGDQVEIMCEVAPAVPAYVVGDPGRLRQVLLNQQINALSFTTQGEVVLRVGVLANDEDRIALAFTVRDTGIGIPAEQRARLFDAFHAVEPAGHRRTGGPGLGLAIAARLVALMQGEITVESEVGKGSTFRFTASFGRAGAEAPLPVTLVRPAELRVLVVDDHPTNRLILLRMLAHLGVMAEAVADGPAALEHLRAALAARPFTVLLSDVQMPRMDGFDLARAVRGDPQLAGLRVLLLSSDQQEGDVARCRELEIEKCLLKPVRVRALRDALLRRAPEPAPAGPGTPCALHLLLVEDNVVNQKVTRALLEKMGHAVTLAPDGRTAVRHAADSHFDAILMDVQLPEMDGLEAAAAIRRFDPNVPILAMTAYAMKGDRERCLAAGMNDYIAKPVARGELAEALARYCAAPGRESAAAQPAFDQGELRERVGDDAALLAELLALSHRRAP
jgi:signal transduction histidine kinase/CheY-like chemotaxis protein